MNMKKHLYLSLLAAASALLAGCAKSGDGDPNDNARRDFESWIATFHPDATVAGSGIYILEDTPGTGAEFKGADHFAFVHYDQRSLDGTISATNREEIAKQLGTYDASAYYGPVVWQISKSYIYAGIQEALCGDGKDLAPMREGGRRSFAVPSWLQSLKRRKNAAEYLRHETGVASAVYTVTLEGQTADILQWQLDTLAAYAAARYGIAPADSVKEGFYYARTGEPEGNASLAKDTTVYLNYTGRLLNGQVFDTTIRDTARRYHLESASASYGPVKVTCSADVTKFKMGSTSSTLITGFGETLQQMHPYEKGTGMFYCYTGYGIAGNNSGIPAYAPLVFEIELTDNPNE